MPKHVTGSTTFDIEQPCKSCPYRKDVEEKRWHKEEFENLVRQDRDPMFGHIFGCHQDNKKENGRICAGWVLDQKRRGIPSLQFRMKLMHSTNEERAQFEKINGKGLRLYRTIQSMCRANGVDPKKVR